MKLGLIKEGKVPQDHRVALTPKQCKKVQTQYPEVEIVVQTSAIRCFSDAEYREQGIEVVEDLSSCDIILGVKEVNIQDLIPNKRFMFFSHTLKKQAYNRNLLKAILDKKIQLIDYEVLKDKFGKRIVGFGRYAGIVGCYNGFRTFGIKTGLFDLKAAHNCADRKEMEEQLQHISLPKDTKIVLTGWGRVGNGAREVIDLLPIKEVTPAEFLKSNFDEPVFTHLDTEDYFKPLDGSEFVKADFYSQPEKYKSIMKDFLKNGMTMYIPCHYWSSKSPVIITKEDLMMDNLKLKVVADVSCDIAGPIASTIRPSTIADPMYGYDVNTGLEVNMMEQGAIAVMAIDNLPCELPKDASEDFGNELIKNVFPALFREDPSNIIELGSETDLNGELTPHFAYLSDYVNQ